MGSGGTDERAVAAEGAHDEVAGGAGARGYGALVLNTAVHILVLVLMPPLLQGIIVKTKAAFGGRVGAPLLQLYYDLFKLFRKGSVLSRTTTWVFIAGPVASVVSGLLAGLLLPLGGGPAPIHFDGDMILFAYLLALGRFFVFLAAMDTGSAFEGMGAARGVTFACFSEPAVFLALIALARLTGGTDLSGLLGVGLSRAWVAAAPTMVMLLAGLLIVALAENSRVPFDDPSTHLELTMIHEVMVLDHSGPALGAVLYGAAVKLFVLTALVARILVPGTTGNAALDWLVFLAAVVLLVAVIGVIESVMARLRLVTVPNLLVGACLLTGFGFVLLLG
jgi:formate hydrogenlyase subunit 4